MDGITDVLNVLATNRGNAKELLQAIHGQATLELEEIVALDENQIQLIKQNQ